MTLFLKCSRASVKLLFSRKLIMQFAYETFSCQGYFAEIKIPQKKQYFLQEISIWFQVRPSLISLLPESLSSLFFYICFIIQKPEGPNTPQIMCPIMSCLCVWVGGTDCCHHQRLLSMGRRWNIKIAEKGEVLELDP